MDENELKTLLEAFFSCLDKNPNNPGICIDNSDYIKTILAINNKKGKKFTREEVEKAKDEVEKYIDIYKDAGKSLNQITKPSIEETKYAIFRAKEEYVKKLLNEYVDSWDWDKTSIPQGYTNAYIPYAMGQSKKKYKNRRTAFYDAWKMIEDDIDNYSKDYIKPISDYDYQYYSSSNGLGNITEAKGAPQMYKGVFSNKELLKKIGEETFKNTFIECYKKHKNEKDLKGISDDVNSISNLMKAFAIGIDCSGFVSRALATVFEKLMIENRVQIDTLGDIEKTREINNEKFKLCKTNATTLAYEDPLFKNRNKFTENQKKKCLKSGNNFAIIGMQYLRVGDVICSYNSNDEDYHIRIVIDVKRNEEKKVVSYQTAESTSKEKKVYRDFENYIGIWRSGILKMVDENFVIVRPHALELFYNYDLKDANGKIVYEKIKIYNDKNS